MRPSLCGRILIPPPSPRSIPSPHDGEVGRGEILPPIKAPNSKLQRSSMSQAPRQRACDRFWNLKFGISLELGVWDLVFRSLTSRPEPIHSLSRHLPSPLPARASQGEGPLQRWWVYQDAPREDREDGRFLTLPPTA